jgi:hypothetical protein
MFFPHQQNSSTLPLSTPTVCNLPHPPYIADPPYQAWRTSSLKENSAHYFQLM